MRFAHAFADKPFMAAAALLLVGAGVAARASEPASGPYLSGGAAALLPPSPVRVADVPADAGGAVELVWDLSPNDRTSGGSVTGYSVLRSDAPGGPFLEIGRAGAGSRRYVDAAAGTGVSHWYRIAALAGAQSVATAPLGPARASRQWFNRDRRALLLVGAAIGGAMLLFALAGRRGRRFRMRRLAAVDAIEQAVDLAADSGRPLLFCPGSQDLSVVQTVASLPILGEVGRRTARRGVRLQAPQFHPLVMVASDEILQEVGAASGSDSTAREDGAYYVSDEQFGYFAGVSGQMVRERPAACLYFGSFYAESLALAEVGREIGALQIAGTGQNAQLPFLMASCDHVLIGEEMFAAAAYLGDNPVQLGILRGQDFGKLFVAASVVLGCLAATMALSGSEFWQSAAQALQAAFEASPRR